MKENEKRTENNRIKRSARIYSDIHSFGFRDGYKGPVKTILLQDVLLDDKNLLNCLGMKKISLNSFREMLLHLTN